MKYLYKYITTMITGPRLYLGPDDDAGSTGDTEMSSQDLQDAVSEGIDTILDGDADDDAGDDDGNTDAGEEDAATDDDADAGGEGEDAPAGEAADDGGTGDGVTGDDDATGDTAGDDAAEDQYAVPEGLNERSQERFTKLVETNKEKDGQIGQMTETIQGFHQMVQNTGMSNPEFMDAITVMGTIKKDPEAGIKQLQGVIEQVAKEHGISIETSQFDILDEYPDLKQDVEDLHITRERAYELIKARTTTKNTEERETRTTENNNKIKEYNDAKAIAVPALTKYLDDAQNKDLDWAAKHEMMMEAAKHASANLHPKEWLPYMESEYKKISRIASSVSGNKGNGHQPLMGNNSVRGGQKEPKDIGSWIDNNL